MENTGRNKQNETQHVKRSVNRNSTQKLRTEPQNCLQRVGAWIHQCVMPEHHRTVPVARMAVLSARNQRHYTDETIQPDHQIDRGMKGV